MMEQQPLNIGLMFNCDGVTMTRTILKGMHEQSSSTTQPTTCQYTPRRLVACLHLIWRIIFTRVTVAGS